MPFSALAAGEALKRVPWKWVGAGLLLSAVVGYIGWLKVQVAQLETTVAVQQVQLVSKDQQIGQLKSSVASQNEAIDQWRLVAESKREQADEALAEALEQSRASDRLIRQLQARGAQTCEEGIDLIDEALGL